MNSMRFSKIHEKILFDWKFYRAISGSGALPNGDYDVAVRRVVDKGLGKTYTAGGASFYIPLVPKFETHRSRFGIHPDGNVQGTLGCVGIVEDDALAFWNHWMRIPRGKRPTLLVVED